MEIEQSYINYLDDKIEDNVLHPENYKSFSFYPAPIGQIIHDELVAENVSLEKEVIKERCRHKIYKNGKQEWILDGDKILVRMELSPLIHEGKELEGWLSPQISTPYRDSKKL